jgi:hypothetical protein
VLFYLLILLIAIYELIGWINRKMKHLFTKLLFAIYKFREWITKELKYLFTKLSSKF